MKEEIKVIHVSEKVAKNGNKYQVVHALITINGVEFVRKFYIFS